MKNRIAFYIFILLPFFIFSQQKSKKGKIITEYGKTYTVSDPDFKTKTQHDLKAVFDVGRTFKDSSKVNPLFNTAARYLNMHADAGIPVEKLKVALVIHGSAANDILNNANYKAKYNIDNPNAPLLSALAKKGVHFILCGQTAAHRDISKEDTLPEIQIALSAMTALVQLQNENYRLINF
ncbi:DsrE family protein [Aquimarina macrocephali]|uniref:DsrE family protein n=1 Tax=Aquimarina macrocephali TaxID=666563 RepID=UPI0004648062|nr:DsrE family protein [Aquimarina macrocephali]